MCIRDRVYSVIIVDNYSGRFATTLTTLFIPRVVVIASPTWLVVEGESRFVFACGLPRLMMTIISPGSAEALVITLLLHRSDGITFAHPEQ